MEARLALEETMDDPASRPEIKAADIFSIDSNELQFVLAELGSQPPKTKQRPGVEHCDRCRCYLPVFSMPLWRLNCQYPVTTCKYMSQLPSFLVPRKKQQSRAGDANHCLRTVDQFRI